MFIALLHLLSALYGGGEFDCLAIAGGQVCRNQAIRVDYDGERIAVVGEGESALRLEWFRGEWRIRKGTLKVENDATGRLNTATALNLENSAVRVASGLLRINKYQTGDVIVAHPLVFVKSHRTW